MLSLVVLVTALAWLLSAERSGAQTLDERVWEISGRLMCPVCEGQTVAESNAELAEQMRALIRDKLKQGKSPEEIITYFVSRYGESILAAPPKRGLSLIVWIGPFAVLVLAAAIAISTLRRWTRTAPSGPADAFRP
ncbi:MAG: cytochrome c-type biogenesis protein [bacterium]